MAQEKPSLIHLPDQRQFRIIPSVYPPIDFFESLVDPDEMEVLYEIEGLTNDRLRQETGDIFLVAPEDRVSGPGSSVVMAAFTHINYPSRFSDGTYGVYYASLTLETAICETVYHRERFFRATEELPCEITMRVYEGRLERPLHDIRARAYQALHHPDDYGASQAFGRQYREEQSFGLIYQSVRDVGGTCIAAFKPKTISIPSMGRHLRYCWNGHKIAEIFDIGNILSIK